MKRWEYRVMHDTSTRSVVDMLDEVGSQGWELVTVAGAGSLGNPQRWIFKREVVPSNAGETQVMVSDG